MTADEIFELEGLKCVDYRNLRKTTGQYIKIYKTKLFGLCNISVVWDNKNGYDKMVIGLMSKWEEYPTCTVYHGELSHEVLKYVLDTIKDHATGKNGVMMLGLSKYGEYITKLIKLKRLVDKI